MYSECHYVEPTVSSRSNGDAYVFFPVKRPFLINLFFQTKTNHSYECMVPKNSFRRITI